MQQFLFNPAGIFLLKDTLKIYKGKKIPQNSQALGFIIDSPGGFKFLLILICLRVNDTLILICLRVNDNSL